MRLSRIEVTNFLGLRQLDLAIETPVTLILGPNGAGKSSVIEAVRTALTGEVSRVGKRELAELVSKGETNAKCVVSTAEGQAWVEMPDWLWSQPHELTAGAHVALTVGHRFASLGENQARATLLAAVGVSIDGATMVQRMLAKGLDKAKVSALLTRINASIEAAERYATDQARECKGAWRGITGEMYGPQKAKDWMAPGAPVVDGPTLDEARKELEQTQAAIAELREDLGGTRAKMQQCERERQQAQAYDADASMLDARTETLKAERERLAAAQATADRLRAQIVSGSDQTPLACPHCGGLCHVGVGELLEYTGPDEKARKRSHEAAKKLVAAEREVAESKRQVEACERSVYNAHESARLAQRMRAAALADSSGLEATLGQLEEDLAHRVDLERTLLAQIKAVEAAQAVAAQASERTAKARKHHADVAQWEAIAEALSPSGIQAELMDEAMAPVIERLAWSAAVTGWSAPFIDADMEVSAYGDIAYPLLSESERWRVDAMIAEALVHVSGAGVLLLDRADVLDLKGRSQLIKWLAQAIGPGDTAIVGMTLKARPERLPAGATAHWLPDVINPPVAQEAA